MTPLFDVEKAIATIKYILINLGGNCDIHKTFKILYFAEQQHLVTYGRPITGDRYIAMSNGPVPSVIYDVVKFLRGTSPFSIDPKYLKGISIVEWYIWQLTDQEIDMDVFSDSEIDELDKSIRENKDIAFKKLSNKSHDSAWHKGALNNEMTIEEIAKAGNADESMIDYINFHIENQSIYLK